LVQKGSKLSEATKAKLSKARKGMKFSEEWKRNIGKASKGRIPNEETRKKISRALKGRKPSPQTLQKSREARLGSHHTLEARRRISEKLKGHIPWNKDKTGVLSKEARRRISEASKGRVLSAETRKKISQANKGIRWSDEAKKKKSQLMKIVMNQPEIRKRVSKARKGIKFSEAHKKNIGLASKGRIPSKETRKKISESFTPEQRQKVSVRSKKLWQDPKFKKMKIEQRLTQIIPSKDTKPEKIVQGIMTDLGKKFETHKPIKGQPDIFIEPNYCIFIDGDRWHANPSKFSKDYVIQKVSKKRKKPLIAKDVWERDKKISDFLKKSDYKVLRIWENEIKSNQDACVKKILNFVS